MDTTKEYIKMSEKVDLAWTPQVGDFCFDGKFVKIITEIVEERFDKSCNYWTIIVKVDNSAIIDSEELAPIFRQDQLQEMVKSEKIYTGYGLAKQVNDWLFGNREYFIQFDSMEQLWLAFVMKEKYGKTWNGKDWIENAK